MPPLDQDRFMALVAEAVDSLPAWVHDTLDNVEILIDDEPPSGQRNLLGLYEGIPLTARGDNYYRGAARQDHAVRGPAVARSRW